MKDINETQKGYIEGGYQFFFLEDQKQMDFEYHYHNFHKCLIILEGKVKYEIEGRVYHLLAGDIIWVPSYEAHKVNVSKEIPYRRVVVYLSKTFVSLLSQRLDQSISQMGREIPHCVKLSLEDLKILRQIFPESNMKNFKDKEKLNSKVEVYNTEEIVEDIEIDQSLNTITNFIKWMNYYFEIVKKNNTSDLYTLENRIKGKQEWITSTMDYIKENLKEELSIEDLARRVYLSKYYFMRKFKETLGISIHQYIIQQRIIHARYLMKQGMSLTEISYQSGFKDYSTFARSFKRTYSKSPREFQKLNPSTDFE